MINFILGMIVGMCLIKCPILLKIRKKWYVDYLCKKRCKESETAYQTVKLPAIRLYRQLTGAGLKEAKEYIEKLCKC